MGKYVGITSRNPELRKREHKAKYRHLWGWAIIDNNLTYEKAQRIEDKYKQLGFKAHPGGQKVSGAVYSVYVFTY